jgi:hypothetical protein
MFFAFCHILRGYSQGGLDMLVERGKQGNRRNYKRRLLALLKVENNIEAV